MALKTNIVQVKVTYDAGKLLKRIPKIITNYCGRYARSSVTGAKENIDKGVVPPLRDITIDIRKKRNITGTKPLYETGALHRSIKWKKDGVQMLKYGIYHQEGYKIKKNSFTDFYYIKTKKEGKATQLAGKAVPARPFLFPSQKTILKSFDAFKKYIRKGMRK